MLTFFTEFILILPCQVVMERLEKTVNYLNSSGNLSPGRQSVDSVISILQKLEKSEVAKAQGSRDLPSEVQTMAFSAVFLDSSITYYTFYMRLCPSVGPSVTLFLFFLLFFFF